MEGMDIKRCANSECENLEIIEALKKEVDRLKEENRTLNYALEFACGKEDAGELGVKESSSYIENVENIAAAEALLRGEGGLPLILNPEFVPVGNGITASVGEDYQLPTVEGSPEPRILKGIHSMNILCCAFAHIYKNDKLETVLLTGGADRRLVMSSADDGIVLSSHEFDAPVICLSVVGSNGDKNYSSILIGTLSGSVYFAQLLPEGHSSRIKIHDQPEIKQNKLNITDIKCSSCKKWVAIASRDRTVNVYKYSNSEERDILTHERALNCASCPESIEFVSNVYGSLCLVVSILDDNCLQYVALENTSEKVGKVLPVGKVEHVNMNENGDSICSFNVLDMAAAPSNVPLLAVATDKSRIIVFRSGSTKQVRNLYGHTTSEYSRPKIAWHPTGKFIFSTSDCPYSIFVWSICSGKMIKQLTSHTASIRGISINAENSHILSCSFDKTLCVWDDFASDE